MSVRFLAVLAALAALQSPSQPAFRTGVDLIRLDVSVVDNAGRPVEDLKAEDFAVRIDGTPRTVSTLKFYGTDATSTATAAAPAASGFVTNVSRPAGRVVIFVVDLESMRAGYEKLVLDTAGTLLDRLGPSDAAGLMVIPGKGVELTRDHARVKTALTALRGFAPASFARHALSISEADAFVLQNRRVMGEVIERECRPNETSCPPELVAQAKELVVEATRRIQNVLTSLTSLSTRLETVDAPKSIVLLSAGLPVHQESLSRFRDLQRSAAASGIMTYVVQLEQPETDASSRRTSGVESLPRGDLEAGLSAIAGVTGGSFYHGVGRALGAFERIQGEITSSYQLGVDALPQDAGKPRDLDVKVKRPGLTVRARKEVLVSATPRPAPKVADVLSYPTDVADTQLAVAAYSTRGDESSTLKVILLVERLGTIAPPASPTSTASYAITVTKDGQPVFQTADAFVATDPTAVMAVQLAPGQYRLRAAVVDAQGKPGSVDMPLGVGLRPAGVLQFSDLIAGTVTARFTPATHFAVGTAITALLDIYTTDPQQFEDMNVDLELRRSSTDAVVARANVTPTETPTERRRVAEAALTAKDAPPGGYVIAAIVKKGIVPVGKVTRAIVITAP